MPSNEYNYPSNDETADDLLAELATMDWAQPESVNDAAEILMELSHELDEFATGWSTIPAERQEAVTDMLNDTLERRTLAYDDTLDGANRERLQESLSYLLDRDEPGLAFRLEQNVMANQRLEWFREAFPGEPLTHGNLEKGVNETFIELAATIPQAMANYRHLLGDTRFEAVEQALLNHEVNRMAYRLNLEINDKLLESKPTVGIADMAAANGISEELLDRLHNYEYSDAQRLNAQRWNGEATARAITTNALIATKAHNITQAIVTRNEENLYTALDTPTHLQTSNDEELSEFIQEARVLANVNDENEVVDGAKPYRLEMSEPRYTENNWKRIQYLEETGQREARLDNANDCVTSTLNEMKGGTNYGWAHDTITAAKLHGDADSATTRTEYAAAFSEAGLTPVLNIENWSDPMSFHIDLREASTLLQISNAPGLDYAVETAGHVVAIVNGTMMDSEDNRRMGDENTNIWGEPTDHHATEIWVKSKDPATLQRIAHTLNIYRKIRERDDILTYGKWRRAYIVENANRSR